MARFFDISFFIVLLFCVVGCEEKKSTNFDIFKILYTKDEIATKPYPIIAENDTTDEGSGLRYFIGRTIETAIPFLANVANNCTISPQCYASLTKYVVGLINVKFWALEMLDASSKLPSGMLEGTLSDLGAFDQCLDIELPSADGSTEFRGEYCGVKIKALNPPKRKRKNYALAMDHTIDPLESIEEYVKEMNSVLDYFNFHFGVCVPSKCSLQDVRRIAQEVGKKFELDIQIPKCYVRTEVILEPIHIAVICAISILSFVCICGAIIEYKVMQKSELNRKCNKCQDLFICFSLIKNYKGLIASSPSSDKLRVLQGMRALTIAWVMLGHNYAWTNFALVRRPQTLTSAFQKLEFGLILNSWLSVESFFVINGLTAAYSVLQLLPASKGRINVPFYILRRYFKSIALLILTIGLAFYMPILSSGPFWYRIVDRELNNCRQRWWAGILAISNWMSMNNICISTASWYISTDLQLHTVSIIPLYILYRCPKLGTSFVICIILSCCLTVGAITYINDLLPIVQMTSGNQQKLQDTIDLVHLTPFAHAGPYYVGVILGYILVKHRHIKISMVQHTFGWMLSSILAVTALYGAHSWNIGQPHGPLVTALFAAAHRTTYAMAVAWVIFICISGNGGLISNFLSSSILAPFGRLTFIVFLLHSLVFWVRKASDRERLYVSHYNLIYEYIGNVILTVAIGIPCYLLLDAPLTNLDNLFFAQKKGHKKAESDKGKYLHNTSTTSSTWEMRSCHSPHDNDILATTHNITVNHSNSSEVKGNSYKTVIYL